MADDRSLMESLLRPARRLVRRQLDRVERLLLGEIRHVRDELQAEAEATGEHSAVSAAARAGETPADLMRALLERSTEQTQEDCETAYFLSVLKTLVPDEARILSALSDGAAHPLVHVAAGSLFGAPSRQVLENLSSIGKVAGIQWTRETATYVTRLRNLGLVETGPEEPALLVKYQILETDSVIMTALEQIRAGGQKATILRRSLRISRLGQSLWDACQRGG